MNTTPRKTFRALRRADPGPAAPARLARGDGECGYLRSAGDGAAAAGPPALGGGALAGGHADGQSAARVFGRGIEAVTRPDARVQRLRTVPCVGPVTAAAFVATIDDAQRFHRAHEVEAYLGLVPRELSSGESQRRGRITKVGNRRMRGLLVQAAVSMLRLRDPRTAALRRWATGIAARRGKKIAVVALARRLAGLLYAMLRDGTTYAPRVSTRPADRGGRSGLRGGAWRMREWPISGIPRERPGATDAILGPWAIAVHPRQAPNPGIRHRPQCDERHPGLAKVRRVGERVCRRGRCASAVA